MLTQTVDYKKYYEHLLSRQWNRSIKPSDVASVRVQLRPAFKDLHSRTQGPLTPTWLSREQITPS
jgi:hypothetical protein